MLAGEGGFIQEPSSYFEVFKSPDKAQWLLKENRAWELVERPKNVKVVQNRWGISSEECRKRWK